MIFIWTEEVGSTAQEFERNDVSICGTILRSPALVAADGKMKSLMIVTSVISELKILKYC